MTNEEKKMKLMQEVGGHLAEHLAKNDPVTAAFAPYGIRFPVIGTDNKGMMQLFFYKAPDQLGLQLGVYRQGTDRLFSNYLPSAPAEEMIRSLRDPASHRAWLEQVDHLSERVDAFWA